MGARDCLATLMALLLPPVAVAMVQGGCGAWVRTPQRATPVAEHLLTNVWSCRPAPTGCGLQVCINLLLCLLGWIPGVIHVSPGGAVSWGLAARVNTRD
jgi:uncharacterized membrane protein YqaE (UPF0057 family)